MKKTITLKPSYATTNTVRFDEDGTVTNESDFLAARTVNGAMGKPFVQYLDADQLAALAWKPSKVGESYVAEGSRGKTYTRRDIEGPALKLTIEVA